MYHLSMIVEIVGAQVAGLQIHSHSNFLTNEASVYLAGGFEKF
jgi:hypothetical protein